MDESKLKESIAFSGIINIVSALMCLIKRMKQYGEWISVMIRKLRIASNEKKYLHASKCYHIVSETALFSPISIKMFANAILQLC